MIYITGDLHGNFTPLLKFSKSIKGKALTKKDYVIVLGDFGLWPETLTQIKELGQRLNFTLLFIEGNHEHYPTLESFPKKHLFGGWVHDVLGIYHLCRSEIYTLPLDSKKITIAVCGGGDSKDKNKRTEGVDWFPQEQISESDVLTLFENAKKYDMQVDYFLSHSLSAAVKTEWNYECLSCTLCKKSSFDLLESDYRIRDIVGVLKAQKYLSAHEHIDRDFCLAGKQYRSVYTDFVELE
mgnify:CR=1 FL=1